MIDKQMRVADNIYEKLRVVDPYCVLAGGAPRDWYLGYEAKDLDFYFVSVARTINAVRKQLQAAFGREVSLLMDREGHAPGEMYKCMPNLVRIWEMEVDEQPVQLIQLCGPGDQWRVVDNMDVSICKAWYLPERGVQLHEDFKLTMASKVMFLKEGYTWSDKHGQKMISYFNDQYYAGDKQQAVDKLVRSVLKGFDNE